jgi:hypothetical protein
VSARAWLTLSVAVPPAALLALALPRAVHDGPLPELPCWVLSNLQVMPAPGGGACPIELGHTLARVQLAEVRGLRSAADLHAALAQAGSALRVELREGARARWVDVPVHTSERPARLARLAAAALGALLLLGTPLFLVWRSSARAAAPLAVFYGCVSLVLVTLVTGQHSASMTHVALVALVLAPAAAAHLGLVFPRERPFLREAPALVGAPYAAAGLLLPIGWIALARDSLLWPAFVSLIFGVTAGAWLVLALSCWFAVRESRSEIERARARIVLYGGALAPLAPAWLLAGDAADPGALAASYLWSAAVAMPLPIAVAIGRYNLFDLESDVRHAIARILYLALAGAVLALGLRAALAATLPGAAPLAPAPLFVLALAGVAAIESLRGRTLGALEGLLAPRLQRLRQVREELSRALAPGKRSDEIARLLLEALRRGVDPRDAWVLLRDSERWRVACGFGDAPPSAGAVREATRLVGCGSLLHLAASPSLQEDARALSEGGVEAVLAIESGGARDGLLLVGSPCRRRPLSGLELEFCASLAARAAVALHDARTTAELVAVERHAATGRAALGLAHDVGKDLGWMRLLVRRLPALVGDPERLGRDAAAIGELTDGLASAIERFVREATTPCPGAPQRFDALVAEALRRVERLHGSGRVAVQVAPALAALPFDATLGRAIGNLLDNALHASAADALVRLSATRDGEWVAIEIEDHGCGIPEPALVRVLEPGFTTRADAGGSGVGLPVALEIAEALGGTLELRSNLRGTHATIRAPVPRP